MSHLKQINQKLDTLLERVVIIESLLIRVNNKRSEDDHYWDPTKYPTVEDSDTIIGEANEHFKN